MGKQPAFQFYPGDWRRDTQVQMANMETRGVWIEMLCCMWDAPERGKITGTVFELARLLGCDEHVLNRSLNELKRLKIADVTNCHNEVTVVNRRMSREEKERDNARLRKQSQRKRERSHADVTPPSSSSTSPSKNSSSKEEPLGSGHFEDKIKDKTVLENIIETGKWLEIAGYPMWPLIQKYSSYHPQAIQATLDALKKRIEFAKENKEQPFTKGNGWPYAEKTIKAENAKYTAGEAKRASERFKAQLKQDAPEILKRFGIDVDLIG